jgi:hypothetical protein
VPTTRHISTVNETNPLSNSSFQSIEHPSPELPLPEELNSSVTNDDISIDNQITCPIVNDDDDDDDDNDDDDLMPVVAFVEEEQPLEDSTQTEMDTSFVIVESTDCNDEKIQLDDTVRSYASDCESSAVLSNIDINIHEEDNETNAKIHSREQSPSIASPISPQTVSIKQKKVNKKHQRYRYGKSCARSRSSKPRNLKKQRSIENGSSLVTIITRDHIEQHLRTLFMSFHEPRRTRTRSVKTPTRLVEEINTNNNSMKIIEPDTNVFDILASTTTTDTISNTEPTQNHHQSCTYNVIISNKPNKLGLTIKKVVQSEL